MDSSVIVKVNAFFILITLFAMTTSARGDDVLCSTSQESASASAIKSALPYQGSFAPEKKRITVRVKKAGPKVFLSREEKAVLQFLTVADDRGQSCVLRSPSFKREKATDGCEEVSVWVAQYEWDAAMCGAIQNPIVFLPGARHHLRAPPPQTPLPIKPELVALSQEKAFSPVAIQCPPISAPRMVRWRIQVNRAIMELETAPHRFEHNGIAADDCMRTGLDGLDFYYCRYPFSAKGPALSAYTLVFDGPRLVFSISDGSWTGADSYTQFNYDRQDVIASYSVGNTVMYVFRAGYVLYRDGKNWYASYRDSFLYTGATECDEPDEKPADVEKLLGAASCVDQGNRPGKDMRFQKAYALQDAGKYQEALALFQQKINSYPDTCDIDYNYAWATLCLAHLDRLEEALKYYRIMRTRFPGDWTAGSSGAVRNWDNVLKRVRDVVALSRHPNADEILKRMLDLDEASRSLRSRD